MFDKNIIPRAFVRGRFFARPAWALYKTYKNKRKNVFNLSVKKEQKIIKKLAIFMKIGYNNRCCDT